MLWQHRGDILPQLWRSIVEPYVCDWESGHPFGAIGRAVANLAMLRAGGAAFAGVGDKTITFFRGVNVAAAYDVVESQHFDIERIVAIDSCIKL
jgi:hypothetical protein